MKKISDLIGHEESERIKEFKKSIKGKPKAEVREMEMAFFKAKPIKKYLGARASKSEIFRKTLKLVFRSEEEIINIMGKFMVINAYLGYNSYDVEKLLALVQFANKELKYNDTKKTFTFKKKRRLRKRNS